MFKSPFFPFLTLLAICLPAPQNAAPPTLPYAPNTWQQEMLKIVNQTRAQGCQCGHKKMSPKKALKWNDKLAQAAEKHAMDMNKNHFIGHKGSNGSRIDQRVDRAGYNWQTVAENVAWNPSSVEGVTHGWKDSPGHCLNIMGGYSEMGAARAGQYWVQLFASPMK